MWVLYRILYIYYTVFLLNRNVGYRVLYFADVVSVVLALHKWWNLRFTFRKQPFCFEKWKKKTSLFPCVLSGPWGHDMLLPDPRLGRSHRGGGKPPPQVLPPRLLWLHWQLQRGVHTRQPQDHRQRPAFTQVHKPLSLFLTCAQSQKR